MMPEKVEAMFVSDGFPCVVKFLSGCYRCGYVGVPATHPLYGKGYEDVNIDCHGGLTFASSSLRGTESDGIWWFGFDCAHYLDIPDFDTGIKYFSDSPEAMRFILHMQCYNPVRGLDAFETVRTLEFCRNECENIARQLKGFENE